MHMFIQSRLRLCAYVNIFKNRRTFAHIYYYIKNLESEFSDTQKMREERSCQKIPVNDECKRELLHFYQSFVLIMNDEDQIRANNLRLRNCFMYLTVLVSFVLSVDRNKR